MILKNSKIVCAALLLLMPSCIVANLTTMQSWDPIPVYNAANLNIPPDTQFCYLFKERLLDESVDKRRRWGVNVSPFVQRAIRAQQSEEIYFGISNTSTGIPGRALSDYQGTPFLMGLFLGQDVNGNSIWGGPTAIDTGNVNDITATNVNNTLLAPNLKAAVKALNDLNGTGAAGDNAIIYFTPTTNVLNNGVSPSILSESVLEADDKYFGAFSTPMMYQKAGFRWELNLDFTNDFGFLVRGGVCQIMQQVKTPIPLAGLAPNPMGIEDGYTPSGNTQTTGIPPSLYGGLNIKLNGVSNVPPVAIAQATFNEWVSNNLEDLFDPINGIDLNYETFQKANVEDMQFLGFWRHTFTMHPADPNKYASIMVTPYVMAGATVPLAPVQDFAELYGLPFGNNSHVSVGGVVGVTFDFIESIEFGFEFGATGFLEKTIFNMPCPNHILQRVIYPYKQDMIVQPGYNGQFAFIFNAFEFAHNTSFSFRYNYVQHTMDTYTLATPSPYFLPSQLEIQSPWASQMFTAALTFAIQPSMYVSAAWQSALSQRNAYCSNTIMASLNFLF